ncbi:RseA family anti-sigma factor [Lysobacter sp. A3-1-A15]|uniref:RseA family anti-sigma factor n=1 Tax=Novilysobacter viscosus TaxID=3098602 RepID=UPI002ED90736
MTPEHSNDDREDLSALFDGELDGDAARFALKRLDHDASWRDCVGSWQLAGDVLRGRAEAVVAGDFAGRVGAAVAEAEERAGEQQAGERQAGERQAGEASGAMARPAATPGVRRRQRAWIPCAALAASVALAAFLVARPLDDRASGRTADVPVLAADPVGVDVPGLPPLATDATEVAPRDVARLDAPQALARGPLVPPSSSDAPAPTSRPVPRTRPAYAAVPPADVVAVAGSAGMPVSGPARVAEQSPDPTRVDPFTPRANEFGSRPWPRAVLPDYRAGNGLTAGYAAPATAPSFYPFEPPPAEPAPPADAAGATTPPPPSPRP